MKGKNVQLERRYYHGKYMTVYTYPVFKKGKGRRKKTKVSSDVQKKLNDRHAQEKFRMLIDNNFSSDDIELQLGFSDDYLPEEYEDVLGMIQKYFRRVRYYYKTEFDVKLKYVGVIEKGARRGRFHAHVTINIPDKSRRGEIREKLEELWIYGSAYSFPLIFNENGMQGMSKYMVCNPDKPDIDGMYKRWIQSKGLKKPECRERAGYISKKTVKDIREGKVTEREIERLYPGYRVSEIESFHNDFNNGEYLVIRLYKNEMRC